MRRHSGGLRTTLGTSVSRSGDTNAPLISRLGYSVSPPGAISPPPLSMYAVPDIYGGELTGKVHNRQGQLLLTCSGDHLEPAFDISMKNRALPGGVDSGVLYDGDDEADDCYEGGDPDQQDGNRSSVAAVGAFLGRVREAWAAVDAVDAVDKQCHSCHTDGINTIAAAFDFLDKAEAQLESDDADR